MIFYLIMAILVFGLIAIGNYWEAKSVELTDSQQVRLPEIENKINTSKPLSILVSMYNLGDPNQNDSSPCVGASMVNLCQLIKYTPICASNCYDMGTILEVQGLGTCIVLDRMNKRHTVSCNTEDEILDWAIPLNQKAISKKHNIIVFN